MADKNVYEEKVKELSSKIKEMSEDELNKVAGGAFASFGKKTYQLTYKGQNLPMDTKISELCKTYPELKDALGSNYAMVQSMTLNTICSFFGEENVQALIDEYSGS